MKTLAVIAVLSAVACGAWAFVTFPHVHPFILIGGALLFGLVAIPLIIGVSATVTFFVLEGIDAAGVALGWWKVDDRRKRTYF